MSDRLRVTTFSKRFNSNDHCLEEIFKLRFIGGVHCGKCNRITKYYKLRGRKAYSCEFCRTQIYPLAGTIFEKTTTPLKTWFRGLFLFTQAKGDISAKQLERMLGVTYKTAWRIRKELYILARR